MTNLRYAVQTVLLLLISASIMTSGCNRSLNDTAVAECNNGDTQQIACGVKDQGTQKQVCIDYLWVDEGRCDDPTECFDGETRKRENQCGPNHRGTLIEQCAQGVWSALSLDDGTLCDLNEDPRCACEDTDVCANGETQTTACGLEDSGEQLWTCAHGQWAADGNCHGAWECENDTQGMMPCGLNARGEQPAICVDHVWVPLDAAPRPLAASNDTESEPEENACDDPDVCVDGEQGGAVACGLENSGTQEAVCKNGKWSPKVGAPCKNAWECLSEDERTENNACGKNHRGTLTYLCDEDHFWTPAACDDPDICTDGSKDERDCESYGANNLPQVQQKSCVNGQWGPWGTCNDSDRCIDGEGGDFTCGTPQNRTGLEFRSCQDGYWETSSCWQRGATIYPAPQGLLIQAADDTVLALGDNTHGALGDSDLTATYYAYPTPTRIPAPQKPEHFSASATHQCAINANQDVRCWGRNDQGQLGPHATASQSADPVHVPLPNKARSVSVGDGFSCALLADKNVYCWGQNDAQQLGRQTSTASDPIPAPAFEGARMLAAGEAHVCAVRDNDVYCWGKNDAHQASEQALQVIEEPTRHPSLSYNPGLDLRPPNHTDMCTPDKQDDALLSIAAGRKHTVVAWRTAWKESKFGMVLVVPFCFDGDVFRYTHLIGVGSNEHGQLAQEPSDFVAEARVMKRIDERMDAFVPHAAGNTTCLVYTHGDNWAFECTGDNQDGQFANSTGDVADFTAVDADLGEGESIVDIALSNHSLCVVLESTGRIRCRGNNARGQLGDGTTDSRAWADFVLHAREGQP